MAQDPSRHQRTVWIADHLWECVELMAREMGAERDALVSQALFQFARQNGYLAPGQVNSAIKPAQGSEAAREEPSGEESSPREISGKRRNTSATLTPATPPPRHRREPTGVRKPTEPDGPARSAAHQRPVGPGRPAASPPLTSDDEPTARPRTAEVDDSVLGPDSFGLFEEKEPPSEPRAPPPPIPEEKPVTKLYLVGQHGELGRVDKPRYIIGRGKHCDLVIHSGKVSREHAAIVQDAEGYFIEDLGSSNGTWYQKKRISRRKIHDGDEFYICSEKIKCVLRA